MSLPTYELKTKLMQRKLQSRYNGVLEREGSRKLSFDSEECGMMKISVGQWEKLCLAMQISLKFWDMSTVQCAHTIFHKDLCYIYCKFVVYIFFFKKENYLHM